MDQKERIRQYNKEYYHKVRKHKITEEDRKKYNAYQRRWREENKDKWKKSQMRSKYGLSEEKYNEIMSVTDCPICNIEFNANIARQKMNIDHCHETGVVRGAICHQCNLALGWFKHDTQMLKNAIKWLKKG